MRVPAYLLAAGLALLAACSDTTAPVEPVPPADDLSTSPPPSTRPVTPAQ